MKVENISQETLDLLTKAITGHYTIMFTYGDESGLRVINPHILYKNSGDNTILDAYQTSGYSSSGTEAQWKMFRVVYMKNISVLSDTFAVADNFNPKSIRYTNIIASAK